jgi:hypothetical protein
MKALPEIKPVEFSQYCLQFNTSYESNIPSQYWQVINNLNHAYSLTPDDLLSGLTLAQVQRIDIRTATPMGITKEQIENVKAKLSSENETSGTITPQRVKKRECLLA